MAARSESKQGRPPSGRPRQQHTLVSSPYCNQPAPPSLPDIIPAGIPKPAGVVRGDGEPILMTCVERRRDALKGTPRLAARHASYTRTNAGGRPAANGSGPVIPSLVQITDTTQFPYRVVCLLEIHTAGGTVLQGSGWLVSPNTIITAGHCVFQREYNAWASYILVHLAVNGTANEFYIVQQTQDIHSVAEWTQGGDQSYDYGCIVLPTPVDAGNMGYTSLTDEQLKSLLIAILGYPAEQTPDHETMWGDQGFLTGVSPTQIYYALQTLEGMSGGPVFYTNGDDRYVVGIHNYGGGAYGNYATRISDPVANSITKWVKGIFQ